MYPEIKAAAGQIVSPLAAVIAKTELVRAVRTIWIQIRVRATLTLGGGPATAILNGGSILSAFDFAGMDENGVRNIEADPRLLAIYGQMCSAVNLDFNRVRATNVANGAYNLEESFWIPFTANIQAAGPMETVFMERNAQRILSAFVRLISTNVANILVQTPGTAVLSAITADVVQRYDFERSKRAVLLPVIRQQDFPVTGTFSELIGKIESTRYLQGMIVAQLTTGAGEVTDIINSMALRADGRDFIGPSLIPYENLQADAQMEFSGDCTSRGYLPIWFRKGGRLSNILNPNAMASLRFVWNCQQSVTAGAGTSFIRVLLLELEKVPGLTADNVPYVI